MKNKKTILILGGGTGGVIAARELRKRVGRSHRIILVNRERDNLFAPSLLWLITGHRSPGAIQRPLDRLNRYGIEIMTGEIETIDPARRSVICGGQEILADFMIISLGAALAPETIPGLVQAGHNFYSLAGADDLRRALAGFNSGRLVILTAAPGYKCPAAPYETALLIENYLTKQNRRNSVSIDLFAAEPAPMGVAGPHVSEAVRTLLRERGITYHPEHQIESVDPGNGQLRFANGSTAPFDLLAYVPPHQAPAVVRASGLTDAGGWIPVDRETLATNVPGVFAIGDVTSIPLAIGKPLPKAGVFAHEQALVVARNIAALIRGLPQEHKFNGHGACFIETGAGRAGYGGGNFFAEPRPEIRLRAPGRLWHLGKILFEKYWLHWIF